MKWSKAMLVEGKETLLGVEKGVLFVHKTVFGVFGCFFLFFFFS